MPRNLTPGEVDAFRAELCRAATGLFVEAGHAAVTMRGLAARLGCSRTTPYRYFTDKAGIMIAVRTAGFERLAERLEAVDPSMDPVERVAGLATAFVGFARDEPAIYALMFGVDPLEIGLVPGLDAAVDRSRKPVLEAARSGVASGQLVGDPVELAHLFWAALHGLIALHLGDRMRLGQDLEALTSAMIDTLLGGCSPSSRR